MHEKDIIKVLRNVRGETDAPLHRARLRRMVLSQSKDTSFAPLHTLAQIISMNKYSVSVGSVLAIAALALVAAVSPLSSPKVVSAEEQVQKAFTRAIAISPEMRAKLEAHMKADMLKTLEEAKAAPDLKIMTKEEFEKDSQFTFSHGPVGGMVSVGTLGGVAGEVGDSPHTVAFAHSAVGVRAEGEDAIFTVSTEDPTEAGLQAPVHGSMMLAAHVEGGEEMAPVTFLSYTNPEGAKVVLGLDKNDTPVFKIATLGALQKGALPPHFE
jgi:hypothetical protein